jgi:hypothetical protein
MVLMPPFAPLVVLAFLGTGAGVALTALGVLAAAIFRRTALLPWIAGLGVLLVLGYSGVLFAASLKSWERTLGPGEWKYFCEIDCHLAYAVEGVETTPTLGPPLDPLRAKGRYRIVRLKTWFDPDTISPRRGDSPLSPNPRVVYVEDGAGKRYARIEAAERALVASGRTSIPLTTSLRPGESYETLLVFDLPNSAPSPRLYVGVHGIEAFLIGHEDSPLHKKIWFRI